QAAALVQFEQPALHHPFGGVSECYEGARPTRHLDGGVLHAARARVEQRDGPARRSAQRGPAAADVAGANHGDLARQCRQTVAPSCEVWVGVARVAQRNTRSVSSGGTRLISTCIATWTRDTSGYSRVWPR